LKNSEIP